MGTIWLPDPVSKQPVEFIDVTSVVLVGANGAGKSRLGAWLESVVVKDTVVHRISAQRALSIAEFITPRPFEQAARMLLVGSAHEGAKLNQRLAHRWGNDPTGHLLDDFDIVLSLLQADHNRVAVDFREQCRTSTPTIQDSRLETAIKIWNDLMPQRTLSITDNKVTVRPPASANSYLGRFMSDGEKVALYLIAECLAAPQNCIIIIDEPELHMNQAIQAKLWDRIESSRQDCVLVYITHDLDFAATRATARKIWVKSFDGQNTWEWEEVHPTDEFPESMVLKILGSRRPILFVEGEFNSIDLAIYRAVFSERLVLPRGSCDRVIESTVALNSLPQLHHTDAYGIIDRDRRGDDELQSYVNKGVFSPSVAEIENLLLLPDAVRLVSTLLKREPDKDLAAIQDFLFAELARELPVQINERAIFQIQQRLNSFPGMENRAGTDAEFGNAVADYLATVNATEIHRDSKALFEGILANRDYPALLKYFNGKSLASRVSRNLGLADKEYPKMVLRLLGTPEGASLVTLFRGQFPGIPH
jgi:energy-coupling factor transporter ATP-binding protein EcfA2